MRIGKGRIYIYHTGDLVVHPGHGGCTVQEIRDRVFGGESKRYYVLIPKTEPNTTILAPIDGTQKIGIRDVISSEQADQILSYLTTAPTQWVKDNAQRRQSYDKAYKSGELTSLAQMIKELTLQGQQANLNQYDKEMLPKAERKLLSEIALAKGIDMEKAHSLMDQALGSLQA